MEAKAEALQAQARSIRKSLPQELSEGDAEASVTFIRTMPKEPRNNSKKAKAKWKPKRKKPSEGFVGRSHRNSPKAMRKLK